MRPTLIITPAAELDIAETIDWYDSSVPGLSSRCAAPWMRRFNESSTTRTPMLPFHAGCPALLRRFSHGVYFRHHQQAIQVVAVLHTSRNPRIWQERSH